MGPGIELDFGLPAGPLVELASALSERNGFFVFDAGIQVFRAGPVGLGYDLQHWNDQSIWKDGYGGMADDLFCFAQDLFGTQFAVVDGARVIMMDAESGIRHDVGDSLDEWAAWLLSDPDLNGHAQTARGWQDQFGAMDVTERLVHRRPLVLGGEHVVENVKVTDGLRLLRSLGPLAVAMRDLPDGTPISFSIDE